MRQCKYKNLRWGVSISKANVNFSGFEKSDRSLRSVRAFLFQESLSSPSKIVQFVSMLDMPQQALLLSLSYYTCLETLRERYIGKFEHGRLSVICGLYCVCHDRLKEGKRKKEKGKEG